MLEVAEELEAVRAAVDRLEGKHQAYVLRRYYFEGATLDSIAAEIGKTKPRIHQIRLAAESLLKQDEALKSAWSALGLAD